MKEHFKSQFTGFRLVVDLGCGSNPRNPFQSERVIGLDIVDDPPFRARADVEYLRIEPNGRLPFGDNSLDGLTAFDVLEHIPRQDGNSNRNSFIEIMNEIYRVLKPGGKFLAVSPCYPSPSAFQDPTHVNFITPLTHLYFADEVWGSGLGYGFHGNFRTVQVGWFPWVGSWLDTSRVFENTATPQTTVSKILRLAELIVFSLFKSRRTHFLWLLEKA